MISLYGYIAHQESLQHVIDLVYVTYFGKEPVVMLLWAIVKGNRVISYDVSIMVMDSMGLEYVLSMSFP